MPDAPHPKLKYQDMEPPGGWVYRDLDTNVWISSLISLKDLVQQVINHRRLNKLPIKDDLADFIEASICYRVDPTLVIGLPENTDPSKEMLTIFKVNKYTTNFLQKWRRDGQELVDNNSANDRAALCANCHYNNRQICLTCKGIDNWIYGWTQRKTIHDDKIGICQCDAVVLYASVHAKNATVKPAGFEIMYPAYCWKRQDKE